MSTLPVIALDAMGGDHAPHEIVRGAAEFVREVDARVILVGQPDPVRRSLEGLGLAPSERERLAIQPADEVISFGEKIASIRTKRQSSMHVGCRLVRDGAACALVSAGHTGAFMAVAKVILGLIDGVDRPALPAPIPTDTGYCVLLDVGANVDCRPEHFRQFAVMGYQYSRRVFGVKNPRVGLLSIGEEDTKGNEVTREVSKILRETSINFIGNVEGNHIFLSRADVVVCDGFVGNVALKLMEGLAERIVGELRSEINKAPLRKLGALALRPAFSALRKRMDYAEYGGVPLLGLSQVAVVAHGRSEAKAIRNALRAALTAANAALTEKTAADIDVLHETERRLADSENVTAS